MSDPIFTSLLSTDLGTVEKPKALPPGQYEGTIKEYKLDKSREKQTPFVRFTFNNISPGADMDPALLVGVDFSKKSLNRDYYLTTDALWRIKDFLQSLGHNVSGKTIGEILPLTSGALVLIDVTQRNSPDGKEIYNDVKDVVGKP